MTSVTAQVRRSRYAQHVLIAVSLSTLYLLSIWMLVSHSGLSAAWSWVLIPFVIGFSLLGFVFSAAYGIFAFALGISFFLQHRTFSRFQLMSALILAITAGVMPIALCLHIREWPPAMVPFVLLQAYLAIVTILESNRQLTLRS